MRSPIQTLCFQTRQGAAPGRHHICVRPAVALSAWALCIGIGIDPAFAAPGDIYNLGTLGGITSSGYDVNDAGQLSGESFTTGNLHPFRYDGRPGSGGVMRDLGTLGGTYSGGGGGINDSGQVAGYSATTGDAAYHAVRYDGTPGSGGVMLDLGTLGGAVSAGWGVNSSGQVAGWSHTGAAMHGFRYDGTPGSGGVMRDLGTLGGTNSHAWDVNDSGQIAGDSQTSGDVATHAIRYDGTPGNGGVMRDLGALPGRMNSYGLKINNSGQVAGFSGSSGAERAFRYDGTPGSDGLIHDLGTLGGSNSKAYGINDSSVVVGWAERSTRGAVAALWRSDLSIVDLDAWLDAVNPGLGAYWVLTTARGINETGLIAGSGIYDDGPDGLSDGERAYLLDASALVVPEPSTAFLLGAAGLGSLLRRRHRRIRRPPPRARHSLRAESIIFLRYRRRPVLKRGRCVMGPPIHVLWFQARQCAPRRRLRLCVGAAVALSTFALCIGVGIGSALAAPGDIYNLGTLGASSSSGWGVNNSGQISGVSRTSDLAEHAFRYDGLPGAGGMMVDLGQGNGLDINASGQVAGWFERYNDAEGHNESRAFRYDGSPGAGGIMHDLGTLGGWTSFGVGVNDTGQVTGYSMITGNAGDRAFLYTGTPGAGGTIVNLGTLGGNYSYGNDVNNAGQVTGEARLAGDTFWHAFRYDGVPGRGGIMRDLGTLGGSFSTGYAINNSGQVVGTAQTTGDTAIRAFRYTGTPGAGGKMVALEPLGGFGSTAFGINDGGFVVGTDADVTRNYATLWKNDAAGTPVDLDAWLDSVNPTIGAFWTLLDARDISNNGLITGHGVYDDGPGGLSDGERAYLLDASALIVPEPSAGILLSAAGIGWLLRRRHRTIRRLAYSIQDVTTASPILMALSAAALLACTSRVSQAEYLAVYGGPAAVLDDPFTAVSAVNDAGRAVGNNVQFICIDVGCSETIAKRRAYRWDAAGISSLEGLGTSANGTSVTHASALNGAGTAIGLSYKYDSFGNSLGVRAVRWDRGVTAATELANLGTNPAGATGSNAVAINDAGVVVGWAHKYDALGNVAGGRAVRWDPSGAITELDIPGVGTNDAGYGSAIAINSDGMAAGSAGGHAVRWDASGTSATLLPSVGPQGGALQSSAAAINDSGTIAGTIVDRFEANLAVNGVAVRWDAAGAATHLDSAAAISAWRLHQPRAINASGTSVGIVEDWDPFYDEAGIIPQFLGIRAVRWDAVGTSATLLGSLGSVPGGSPDSQAYAINSADVAVGYTRAFDGLRHAVYWGIDASAIDLNTLIDPASGWFLISAQDVSDTGWIVGVGRFEPDGAGGQPPEDRHFLMHVPATAATLSGDFNNDGTVDASDYVVWRKNDRTQAAYNQWRANFGGTAPGNGAGSESSNAAIPEPSGMIMLLTAAVFGHLAQHDRPRRLHHRHRPLRPTAPAAEITESSSARITWQAIAAIRN